MTIAGKKKYQLYLDEKNVAFLQEYLDSRPNTGGVSGLLDAYIKRCVAIVEMNKDKLSDIEPGRMTLKKFWQLAKLDI